MGLFADIRAAAVVEAAMRGDTVERDRLARGSHEQHSVSSTIVTHYADGSVEYTGGGARAAVPWYKHELVHEFLDAGQVVPEALQDAYEEHEAECGVNPFAVAAASTIVNDPTWGDMGECDGCGATGRRGSFHATSLTNPFLSACGQYR
jgi:hypothetical protein